jgi:hypothetical protein
VQSSSTHLLAAGEREAASSSWERPWPEAVDPSKDVPEQRSGHRHLRKLEHDVAAVAHDPGAELDQHDAWLGIVFLMSATSARATACLLTPAQLGPLCGLLPSKIAKCRN